MTLACQLDGEAAAFGASGERVEAGARQRTAAGGTLAARDAQTRGPRRGAADLGLDRLVAEVAGSTLGRTDPVPETTCRLVLMGRLRNHKVAPTETRSHGLVASATR
jgi:hypothetical protein